MKAKIIGIIGGMGPEATLELFRQIIYATPARTDQDHIRVLIDCNPKIPDRVSAILKHGKDPVPALIMTAKNLERAGATVLAMPCFTAHYFADKIKRAVSKEFIDILDVVRAYLDHHHPPVQKIGVLATTATIRSRLFERYLGLQYKVLYPSAARQAGVMAAIYGIKQGNRGRRPLDLLTKAGQDLIKQGAQVLVAGCTEIPIVLRPKYFPVPLINPLELLAKNLVQRVKTLRGKLARRTSVSSVEPRRRR